MDLLPLFVAETGGGWEIRSRDGGVVSEHAALRDGEGAALPALAQHDGYRPKEPRFADGVFRWIDMAAVEDAPAEDGSQVTERGIQAMAARLNSGDPIMIDGGSGDSEPHGSLTRSDARANGWVHVGAEVVHADGRLHLWGLAEVLPEIARDMDGNRLALGSIGFITKRRPGGRDNDDAQLVQHALTNVPAIEGLTPAGTPRARGGVIAYRTRPVVGPVAARGPSADALAKMYALIGIDPTAPAAVWQLHDAVAQLHEQAAGEAIAESSTTAKTRARRAERPGGREENSEMDEARLKELLGLPEDADAAAIMAALEERLAAKSEPAEGEAEAAKAQSALASERAARAQLRDEVATLRAQVAALEPLRQAEIVRTREAAIDESMRARGMPTHRASGEPTESRARFLKVATEHGTPAALASIEASHVPPGGAGPFSTPPPSSRTGASPEADAPEVAKVDLDRAIALAQAAVRAEQPALRGPQFHAAALSRARKDHPQAFEATKRN